MKRVLLGLVVGLGVQALAGVSLLTGAVVFGGDRVSDQEVRRVLDDAVRQVARSAGEVCYQTEHFLFPGGLSLVGALLLKSSLESSTWVVEEIRPFTAWERRLGVWYLARKGASGLSRERVLVILFNLSDGSAGFVSFCALP